MARRWMRRARLHVIEAVGAKTPFGSSSHLGTFFVFHFQFIFTSVFILIICFSLFCVSSLCIIFKVYYFCVDPQDSRGVLQQRSNLV